MSEAFSGGEQKSLAPFFTNLDKPIFGLKLPQEIAGALFSRYSRSSKSLRRVFFDEFLGNPSIGIKELLGGQTEMPDESDALKKAREFYNRVLVGYGDDSVAQLGGAHLACEGVSNIAANLLEDSRIGISPLEKSTRYVRFDQKDENGEYPIYKEPKILASPHRAAYHKVMNLLFETYSSQLDPMSEFIKNLLPITAVELKHPRTGETLLYKDTKNDQQLKKWAESAYRSTVRAHACDVLRGYLPAATLTNVGLFGVGQAFEYLLTKLYSHGLTEAKTLAASIHEELNKLIPSFVKRARASEYLTKSQEATQALAETLIASMSVISGDAVTLIEHEGHAEEKVIAAILYPHSRQPLEELRRRVGEMTAEQRTRCLDGYLSQRRSRRDKPGRAFEQVYYTFEILGNLGLYRDLHRHRILSQERQDFTVLHGYDTPPEIEEIGFKPSFDRCMGSAAELWEKLHRDFPLESQYVVPFAYRVRWAMKLNLREAVFLGELRTMPQGHPDYRTIVQQMWRRIQEVHPTLAQYAKFIDWETYRLGRLASEMRTEYKKSAHEK
ncbi:MAG: FAD-dependent thymidylate synthase [Bacteroidota bacterium]